MSINRYAGLMMVGLLLAGCGTPTSQTYEGAQVGRSMDTAQATIVSGRIVDVAGETNAVGPGAGAAIGGAGTMLGTGKGWAGVLGAVVGAGAGYAVQQMANTRQGIEYVLEMEDGRIVTIVQNREGNEQPLPPTTPVLVQSSGTYTRVIVDPRGFDRPPSQVTSRAGSSSDASVSTDPFTAPPARQSFSRPLPPPRSASGSGTSWAVPPAGASY